MVQMKKKKKKEQESNASIANRQTDFLDYALFSNQQARIRFYIIWYQKLHLTDI